LGFSHPSQGTAFGGAFPSNSFLLVFSNAIREIIATTQWISSLNQHMSSPNQLGYQHIASDLYLMDFFVFLVYQLGRLKQLWLASVENAMHIS
jgi:hypothetical protein